LSVDRVAHVFFRCVVDSNDTIEHVVDPRSLDHAISVSLNTFSMLPPQVEFPQEYTGRMNQLTETVKPIVLERPRVDIT
jgi:hypothetical protein